MVAETDDHHRNSNNITEIGQQTSLHASYIFTIVDKKIISLLISSWQVLQLLLWQGLGAFLTSLWGLQRSF